MKHILIDFENVRPTSLDAIDNTTEYQIWFFLGTHQKSLPLSLVKSLLKFPQQHIHFVELQRQGKNALDHYISFYLGKISEQEKPTQVCIISKDKGYDVLIEHVNTKYHDVDLVRIADISTIKSAWRDNVEVMSGNTVTITTQLSMCSDNAETDMDYITTIYPQDIEQENDISIPSLYSHDVREKENAFQNREADCYQLIMNTIQDQDVFLPHFKSNLKSIIRKCFIDADHILFEDDIEYDDMVEKIYRRLLDSNVIEENGDQLIYTCISTDWMFPDTRIKKTSFMTQASKINDYKTVLFALQNLPTQKRPKTKGSLINWLNTKFKNKIPALKVEKSVEKLIKKQKIEVLKKDRINYLCD